MTDIFISYANEDRPRAELLAKALEEQGWSVWWDKTIPPGKTFDQVIEEAITAARCVVVLWSRNSIKSDWVKEEANIGKERQILVPAKIDPVDLPLGFGRIQAADLTNWEASKEHSGFLGLRNAISEVAGPPPQRDKNVPDTELPESTLEQQAKIKSEEIETFQADNSHLKSLEKEPPITGPKAPRKKRLACGIGAVALILVLSFFGLKPKITVKEVKGGSISPSGPVSVLYFSSKTFKITPDPGYRIADVEVDGNSVGANDTHTIENVTSDHTISAKFVDRLAGLGDPNAWFSIVAVSPQEKEEFVLSQYQTHRVYLGSRFGKDEKHASVFWRFIRAKDFDKHVYYVQNKDSEKILALVRSTNKVKMSDKELMEGQKHEKVLACWVVSRHPSHELYYIENYPEKKVLSWSGNAVAARDKIETPQALDRSVIDGSEETRFSSVWKIERLE